MPADAALPRVPRAAAPAHAREDQCDHRRQARRGGARHRPGRVPQADGARPDRQRGEFEDVEGIERSCTAGGERRCRVYYCDPMRSDQKGACERNHVEIRKMLPKGRGISFDDLDEVDAWLVGSSVNSEPRPSLMGLSPLAMLRAADPALAGALGSLGVFEIPYEELDLTLDAVNRERGGRGLAPLA